jgi:hypothetical protein
MNDEVKITPPSDSRSDEVKITEPDSSFRRAEKIARRGVIEAIPFVGEKIAEREELPKPDNFGERLSRRTFRNLPYAAPAIAANPILGTAGLVGATALGQAAEEFGVPESYQPIAEIIGGSIPSAVRTVAGKTMGYIEPQLEELYKKGKSIFELGPGARSAVGMKYGAGETEEIAIRNLNKFTKEASKRAGGKVTDRIDGSWVDKTGKSLGNEANRIFANKIFISDPKFIQEVTDLSFKAEGAFGQQGNVVKTILEKNIGGKRTGGALVSPQFKAEDLRSAIVEVNDRLSSASGNEAKLLHDLKDSLEELASTNLKLYDPKLVKDYENWRKQYNSFATIRDAFSLGGKEGTTAAGQLNPQAMLNVIKNRTGGNPIRNPLYGDLAEFGQLMPAKQLKDKGFAISGLQTLTESPLGAALKLSLQPRAASKLESRLRSAQALSPAQQYTQITPNELKILEPDNK